MNYYYYFRNDHRNTHCMHARVPKFFLSRDDIGIPLSVQFKSLCICPVPVFELIGCILSTHSFYENSACNQCMLGYQVRIFFFSLNVLFKCCVEKKNKRPKTNYRRSNFKHF